MPKFNCSNSTISKFFFFITLFLLLSYSFLSLENPPLNFHEKQLRKLGVEIVFFTIFRIIDYFFYFFFLFAFFAPCLYFMNILGERKDEEGRTIIFFVNKVLYIINIGYLIISGINFSNDVEFGYSLSIFICSFIYFLFTSIIYIIFCVSCKEMCCFPGICEWGYLKIMFIAPCCFFAPCKEEECKKVFSFEDEEVSCDCCKCCCLCCISFIAVIFSITNLIVYFLGLLLYDLFWLIGKFFVFISCCDCWLKEEYDMDSFRFIRPSSESEEDKNGKKNLLDKLFTKKEKKDIKKNVKKIKKSIKKAIKEATEDL